MGKKKNRKLLIILLSIALFLTLIAIIYIGMAFHYEDVFFRNTTINGIDCSELTARQSERLIRNHVEDYSLKLSFRDGSTGIIDGDDIDYKYVSKGDIQKILDDQNPWKWVTQIFTHKEYRFEESVQYDLSKLLHVFYNLESINGKTQISPKDAYVTFDTDTFLIVPEEEGNKIIKEDLYEKVKMAISLSQTELDVAQLEVYKEPEVRQDASDLKKECDQLNDLARVSVTYKLPKGESVLDGNEVRKWLDQDSDGNYSITEKGLKTAITSYVSDLAKKVNTVGTTRKFQSTNRGEIEVSGGTYGYKIDQKAEISQLLEEITSHAIVEREPNYASVEVTDKADGLGDTYVEMDLSAQHLWYYIDGKLYVESDFVSGTYTVDARRTPPGIFLLSYKQKNAVLRGAKKEDGTYEYESPVSYWMPFNRGIGMHDATWRGTFGGTIYKYSGSHGCINLPLKNAQSIFEKIDRETPIILYY